MTVSLYILVIAAIAVFIFVDTWDDRRRLVGAGGALVFILIGWIFSVHPDKVRSELASVFLTGGFLVTPLSLQMEAHSLGPQHPVRVCFDCTKVDYSLETVNLFLFCFSDGSLAIRLCNV